jgi:N-alpha-acetyltransferase 40
MKGQGGGGTARGGGKNKSGGETVAVQTTKARQTKAIDDNILLLRAALFEDNGKDKDVTKDIARSFMKFDRNDLDVSIEFQTKLSKEDASWAFDLVKETMEDKYEASGYGWDDEDKMIELTEKGGRFLVVREWPVEGSSAKGDCVGFVHFRFTVQGEVMDKMAGEPGLFVYDIQLDEYSRRKGLGKHLLMILELIARREKMRMFSLPVQLGDHDTEAWLTHIGRGWAVDESMAALGFDADVEVRKDVLLLIFALHHHKYLSMCVLCAKPCRGSMFTPKS